MDVDFKIAQTRTNYRDDSTHTKTKIGHDRSTHKPGSPVISLKSPTRMAARTLLSKTSVSGACPRGLCKGSMLWSNSFRGLGEFWLEYIEEQKNNNNMLHHTAKRKTKNTRRVLKCAFAYDRVWWSWCDHAQSTGHGNPVTNHSRQDMEIQLLTTVDGTWKSSY